MNNKKYILGIDFGTLSARCVVTSLTGDELGEKTVFYPHGVMSDTLPSGKVLPADFALQHPSDYIFSAKESISAALSAAGITADEILGIGIDFTACTMLPVDEALTPLCLKDEFSDEPHSYVKLWKHHAATEEADIINALAKERDESWLNIYGGAISCEWMLPKIFETLRRAPRVYDATYRFIEAADWLTGLLTGAESRSVSFIGFKAQWNEENGYPSDGFMKALHPGLSGIVGTKLSEKVVGLGQCVGFTTEAGASIFGLVPGIAVAAPLIDAHAALPALGLTKSGDLMMIVGTSSCHIMNSDQYKGLSGCAGCVKDGAIPGLYTFEAGQAAVGDIFDWFVKNCVPASYIKEAEDCGISIHKLLREKAKDIKIGESGLIALDWHNGNRSILSDPKLSAMMLGMTLSTRPEEMYRAWLEASAFGTKMIVENFEQNDVPVGRIMAAGGIALKDELFMQIYADVLGKEVEVSSASQAGALGSAAFAAVAAGVYPDINAAAEHFAKPVHRIYTPIEENVLKYRELYEEYKMLHDYFARGENDVMKRLIEKRRNI